MKVLIVAVGSRGDVAPLTGLGTALRGAGHDVSIASYGVFADLVTGCGLGFRLIPGDPQALGASEQGQQWQEGSTGPMSGIRFVRLIAEHMREVNAAILAAARQDTDVLLLAGLGGFGGYRIAEGLGLPSIGLALQPGHPTSAFPPPTVTTRSLGRWGNRALARATMIAGASALDRSSKRLWAQEGMPSFGAREMFRRQDAARLTGIVAAARRQGAPTVSVPVITDQPFWASRVTALGAGPAAVPYKSLSAESLTAAISDAVSRDSYRNRAQEISKQLASEDGTLPVIWAVDRLAA